MKILTGPKGIKLTKKFQPKIVEIKQNIKEEEKKEQILLQEQFTDFQEAKSPINDIQEIQDCNYNQNEDDSKNVNYVQSGENTKKSEENATPQSKDLFEFDDNENEYYKNVSDKNQSDDWSAKVEIGISPQFVQWDDAPQPIQKSLFVKSNRQLMGFQDSTNLSENDKKEAEIKGEKAGEDYRQQLKQDELMTEMREQIATEMDPIIKKWAFKNEVRNNLRTLIASLHTIAWEESGWKAVDFMEIIEDNNVKKLYKQALIKFHPDKHRQVGKEKNKYLAERITTYLAYAMKEFTAEEHK